MSTELIAMAYGIEQLTTISAILFPLARILPFLALFLIVRRMEKVTTQRIGMYLFYLGVLFAVSGMLGEDIRTYLFHMSMEEAPVTTMIIASFHVVGALFLYLFVKKALHALGERYDLSDIPIVAFVFTSFLALTLSIAPNITITTTELELKRFGHLLMPPMYLFLYALAALNIYALYERLNTKLSFLAAIGSFLIMAAIPFSILPNFGLFMKGSLAGVSREQAFFLRDFFQLIGYVLVFLPIISFYKKDVPEVYEAAIAIYLDKLVDAFGSGVIGIFKDSLGAKNGAVTLKETEEQVKNLIIKLSERYGEAPLKIAEEIDELKPIVRELWFAR